jgi:hypothetical protein
MAPQMTTEAASQQKNQQRQNQNQNQHQSQNQNQHQHQPAATQMYRACSISFVLRSMV